MIYGLKKGSVFADLFFYEACLSSDKNVVIS
ncbi:hypothetical protein F984_00872 [Acinetobacter nosocomialis NIPH 2119]|nr:hypothetical protein F984_00872 [Acinetobacter nosocomialis NIPH 2119]